MCFFTREITLTDEEDVHIKHCLACVKWHEEHPRCNYFHPSIIVCTNLFESPSPTSFIPVSIITGRCAMHMKFEFFLIMIKTTFVHIFLFLRACY